MTYPAGANRISVWAGGILAGLAVYLTVMYGGVARLYIHYAVVGIPWLITQPGYRLYTNITDQHAPGATWLNTLLLLIVPDHILRSRLFMILILLACMGMVFTLARRWWGTISGLAGAALFAAWAAAIMDRPLYYEVWVGLLTLLAVWVWHRTDAGWPRPLIAGLLVGVAILCKQHSLALAAVFVIWRVLGGDFPSMLADIGLFLLGALLPPLLDGIFISTQGRLDDAIYWIWTYNLRDEYQADTARPVPLREIVLMLISLLPVPLHALFSVPNRNRWKQADSLLLGLLPALIAPIYPRYNRFHLSAAVPIAALIGAGAVAYAWQSRASASPIKKRLLDAYGVGMALALLLAFALPTWYRIRLGPRLGEYEALVPIGEWLDEHTDARPGTRVWILPSGDPTDNFYAIHGYLPPLYWSQTYPWFQAVPGQTERVIAALDADPPRYAILVERWEPEIPERLLEYLDSHYTPTGSFDPGYEYGLTTFYELSPSD